MMIHRKVETSFADRNITTWGPRWWTTSNSHILTFPSCCPGLNSFSHFTIIAYYFDNIQAAALLALHVVACIFWGRSGSGWQIVGNGDDCF